MDMGVPDGDIAADDDVGDPDQQPTIIRIPIPPAVCPVFLGLTRSFPVILCWFRTRARLSQTDLASLIGSNRAYISRIENGLYIPKMKSVERLAAALGTSVGKMVMACEVLMADNSKLESEVEE